MNGKDVTDLQKWWMSELQQIARKVMEQEEKRLARARKKKEAILADAAVERKEDIDDLYAYGAITARKRDRLIDIFEEMETPGRLFREKIDLLQDLYQTAKEIVRDQERKETPEGCA